MNVYELQVRTAIEDGPNTAGNCQHLVDGTKVKTTEEVSWILSRQPRRLQNVNPMTKF